MRSMPRLRFIAVILLCVLLAGIVIHRLTLHSPIEAASGPSSTVPPAVGAPAVPAARVMPVAPGVSVAPAIDAAGPESGLGPPATQDAAGLRIPPIPPHLVRSALLLGRLHRLTADYRALRAAGSPDAESLRQQIATLTAEWNQAAQTDRTEGAPPLQDVIAVPELISLYKSLHLKAALQLDEARWRVLDARFLETFTQAFDQGHTLAGYPLENPGQVSTWQTRRDAFGRDALASIRALVAPDQRAVFDRLYPPDSFYQASFAPARVQP